MIITAAAGNQIVVPGYAQQIIHRVRAVLGVVDLHADQPSFLQLGHFSVQIDQVGRMRQHCGAANPGQHFRAFRRRHLLAFHVSLAVTAQVVVEGFLWLFKISFLDHCQRDMRAAHRAVTGYFLNPFPFHRQAQSYQFFHH